MNLFIFYFLGSRVNSRESPDPTGDTFETMSIPPPGVPREIPELNQAVVDSLQEVMDEGKETKGTRYWHVNQAIVVHIIRF